MPAGSRAGEQRRLLDESNALGKIYRLRRIEAWGIAPVADTSGVGQQMMERDLLPLRRGAGKPARYGLCQVELPGFGQQHGRDSGELLADRGDLEPGPRRALRAGLSAGQPARHHQLDTASAADNRRSAQALDRVHTPSLEAPDLAQHSDLSHSTSVASALRAVVPLTTSGPRRSSSPPEVCDKTQANTRSGSGDRRSLSVTPDAAPARMVRTLGMIGSCPTVPKAAVGATAAPGDVQLLSGWGGYRKV